MLFILGGNDNGDENIDNRAPMQGVVFGDCDGDGKAGNGVCR